MKDKLEDRKAIKINETNQSLTRMAKKKKHWNYEVKNERGDISIKLTDIKGL